MSSGAPATAWHALSGEEALRRLQSSLGGLSSVEARDRLRRHGPNRLPETGAVSPLAILAGQFKGFLIWLLLSAATVSALLGEGVDVVAILGIVAVNAFIGFYQEYNAEKALAALRRMTAPQARVRREGESLLVPAADVVPGDVLELEAGDRVPADARLLEASALRHVEAALTGESEPAEKIAAPVPGRETPLADRRNMAFMGTSVAAGKGMAVVVGTAADTEIGRIATLIGRAQAEERAEGTPLQRRLEAFGRALGWASLGIVGLVFVLGWLRNLPVPELFMTSVSLAVAAVPEGLPAVVTIALAVGVQRMARRKALIRKLAAVETLGSVEVICSDKTGTLTVGEMTVRALHVAGEIFEVSGEGYGPEGEIRAISGARDPSSASGLTELLTAFAGCNGAALVREEGRWKALGDPTEAALLVAARKAGIVPEILERDMPRLGEIPFDSDRKRMTMIRRTGSGARALVKGAPDVLIGRCSRILDREGIREMTEPDREALARANAGMAGKALRVLAAACRDLPAEPGAGIDPEAVERDLVFLGLAGMQDPPRPEARSAVALCRSAGIRPVMITGDHPGTALAVARELGIAGPEDTALSGVELDRMTDEALGKIVGRTPVYARVTAAHKLRIVKAWRASGAAVAMTGDGVNDAPALKGADIGIAMGRTGTEVTKEASDMVITDDNFASIVAAVEEGRGVYDNIRKTCQYLLGGNAGELLLMMACVVIGVPLPLLPVHLLWINLVTDGLPALCLATDPVDPDVMRRRPRPRTSALADRTFLLKMLATGFLTAGVSFGVYVWALGHETLDAARSKAFAVLVFAELFRSFGCRSETRTLWETGILSNLKLAVVVALSAGFQIWSHHFGMLGRLFKTPPMDPEDCLWLLGLSLAPLAVLEAWKLLRRRTAHP